MVGLVENNSKKRKRVAKLTLILLCSDSFQRMKGSYQVIVNLEDDIWEIERGSKLKILKICI